MDNAVKQSTCDQHYRRTKQRELSDRFAHNRNAQHTDTSEGVTVGFLVNRSLTLQRGGRIAVPRSTQDTDEDKNKQNVRTTTRKRITTITRSKECAMVAHE